MILVWALALWTTEGGKNFPPFLHMKTTGGTILKELSVFIDESGDFGEITERPSYYLVTLVFHDQKFDITDKIRKLEESIRTAGFDLEYIHTGPVIRREDVFSNYSIDERRKLLYKILNFMNACPITYETVVVNKKEVESRISLSKRLRREILNIFEKNTEYFFQFDKIIVYYDNGQNELSAILKNVFLVYFTNVEFRKAEPQKYRLLQAADFICTLELLRLKKKENRLSKSEEKFFFRPQELKKTFFRAIDKKRL